MVNKRGECPTVSHNWCVGQLFLCNKQPHKSQWHVTASIYLAHTYVGGWPSSADLSCACSCISRFRLGRLRYRAVGLLPGSQLSQPAAEQILLVTTKVHYSPCWVISANIALAKVSLLAMPKVREWENILSLWKWKK